MGIFNGKNKDGNLTVLMKHHQGLPNLAKSVPLRIILDESNEKIIIREFAAKKPQEFHLPFSKITTVSNVTEETIKKANGVGRAIVGGLLFSEVGAVVGAITAKDKTKKVYYKAINYISNGDEKSIVLATNGDINEMKFFAQLEKMFNHQERSSGVTEL